MKFIFMTSIYFDVFFRYLQVEWQTKRGGYRDFSGDHMVGSHCTVPLQDNSSDCGLYLLQYAESFLQVELQPFFIPNFQFNFKSVQESILTAMLFVYLEGPCGRL